MSATASPVTLRSQRASLAFSALLLLGGCSLPRQPGDGLAGGPGSAKQGPGEGGSQEQDSPPPAEADPGDPDQPPLQDPAPAPPEFRPPPPAEDEDDWILLDSGEWLRGELLSVRDEKVEFVSDGLGKLELGWGSVAELRSKRLQTLVLKDRETVVGPLRMEEGEIRVGGPEPTSLERDQMLSIVRGDAVQEAAWSGKLSLGVTSRAGNTRQTDASTFFFFRRETPNTRWDSRYNGAYSEVEREKTANNHRLRSTLDDYLSERTFLTLFGLDAFRDPFQNVRWRLSPFAAIGYDLVDRPGLNWQVSGGPAFQRTRFESVEPGDDDTEDSAAAILATKLGFDLSSDIDVSMSYDVLVPIPDSQSYTHHLSAVMAIDLPADFDLDLSFVWDRVNEPLRSDEGTQPESDDFRVTLGLGWRF